MSSYREKIIIISLSLLSCNEQQEKNNEYITTGSGQIEQEAAKEKLKIYQQIENDSADLIINNFRITGEVAEQKFREGMRGAEFDLWSKRFLDSLNKRSRQLILERRKRLDDIYNQK